MTIDYSFMKEIESPPTSSDSWTDKTIASYNWSGLLDKKLSDIGGGYTPSGPSVDYSFLKEAQGYEPWQQYAIPYNAPLSVDTSLAPTQGRAVGDWTTTTGAQPTVQGGGGDINDILKTLMGQFEAGTTGGTPSRGTPSRGTGGGYSAVAPGPTWRTTAIPGYAAPTYTAPEWDETALRGRTQQALSPYLGQLRRVVREAITRAASTTNPAQRRYLLSSALASYGDALSKGYGQAQQQGFQEYATEYGRKTEESRINYMAAQETVKQNYQTALNEWKFANIRTGAIPANISM